MGMRVTYIATGGACAHSEVVAGLACAVRGGFFAQAHNQGQKKSSRERVAYIV